MEDFDNRNLVKADLAIIFGKHWDHNRLLLEQVTDEINYLIHNDFNRLIFILYKVDVSEEKIRDMLTDTNSPDPGKEIALLVIQRQLEKIERRGRSNSFNDIPEDEKW